MTLVELMIALGIVGFVLLVCYSSSIALQRGFEYTNAWTEARIDQTRVIDSLALDLRNATKIDLTAPALITLTIPNRYSLYYRNKEDSESPLVMSNAEAGNPTRLANPTLAPNPNQFGKIVYSDSDTISVSYAHSSPCGECRFCRSRHENLCEGTKIRRTVNWPGGPVNGASRDIGTFPNNATVTFTPNSPTVMTNTSGVSVITTKITTAPDYRHVSNQSILEDKVFLRELSIR